MTGRTVSYENVPHPDIDATLDAETAAAIAGYSLRGFRTAMSRLNNTPHDLRAPKRVGERGRRYDADRLRAWLGSGKAFPDAAGAGSEASHTIHAVAEFSDGQWVADVPGAGIAVGTSLRALSRNARVAGGKALGVDPDDVDVRLEAKVPDDATGLLRSSKDKESRAKALQEQARRDQQRAVALLLGRGWSQADVAHAFGISFQRVQQIVAEAQRNRSVREPGSGPAT